jgi:hypothetical protein
MHYGTLRVATPDGQIREYPISEPSVVIGRADGNQVVIDHVSVSRRHAQLVIESGRVTISDLGSGTGTFVGGQRVPANTPTLIESGQTMRLGDVEARFVLSDELRGDSSPAARAAAAADSEQTIGVALTSPGAPVAAGSPTTATVLVQNRGNVVDELSISVVDLPEGWARVSRPTISLVPGARDEITIVLQPPRDASAGAGDHEFSVAVTSKSRGREVRALGRLTILPFEGFKLAIQPPRARRDFKVTASNMGNTPITVSLTTSDQGSELDYQLESEQLELQPGEQRTISLSARTKSRKWFGPATMRPFRVEGRPDGAATSVTADAHLTIRPPLQRFRWPSMAVLIFALLGGGAYGYTTSCKDGWLGCSSEKKAAAPASTPTAVASPTATQATPTPAGLYVGGNGVIMNSDPVPNNTNCLAVRSGDTPRIAPDNVLGRLCTGTRVAIKGGPATDGTLTWWKIEGGGLAGWAAEKSADGVVWIAPAP